MKSLIEQIEETTRGRVARAKLSPTDHRIRKRILRDFARSGRASTSAEIAGDLKLPEATVTKTIEVLQKLDLLSRKGDEIISAYPFSAVETRHKVVFGDGHAVYALCATDAFGVHFALNEATNIISRCPACEEEIRIAVKDGRIKSSEPEGVIEFVSNRERGKCTAENLCPFLNFFCSEEHLKAWRDRNPEYGSGEVYSLDQALHHGKIIFGNLLK
jgi:mercuric reductase